ncbi:GNAT family N-acetyltransferase [Clostridium fungisolvens]|uniref:[Ribosomal protein S5]-alanine N-acetyltransferase n=1 Tax=Clostridium fungisolvens TaxID=1604897 RepID=A0A6V8SMK7_9CLOT|nr:GNAT family N-acetyltransferase [Clostridium fungisolvens]GFP76113.1 [Ribosomal protein S5]-alanine N-acetyltransferase [Clostridium fungisolvens]
MQKTYETDRLILKVLDEADAGQVLNYYMRNRGFLEEWEPTKDEEYYKKETHEIQLMNDLENILKENMLRLWIYKKEDENKVIGTLAFSNIVRGAFWSCFLGYKLDGAEINKGYMTEALSKGVHIMFSEFKLHRIEANIMPKNKRSLRVVEKLGFYNEGLAYKYLKINGRWEDHIHMVLLNDKV